MKNLEFISAVQDFCISGNYKILMLLEILNLLFFVR